MLDNRTDQLTIEVTSNCQAKCPGCIRHKVINAETDKIGGPPKNINMTLATHNKLIDEASPLKHVSYDGGFGDSPLHPDFLDMVEYAAARCSGVLTVSTNASMRTPEWWAKLGAILNKHLPVEDNIFREKGHKVFFDLDGVDNETQVMYRINTSFDKIIDNARAFIGGGGFAAWKMIPFEFNEPLEERAKELATKYGFQEFHRDRVQRIEQAASKLAIFKALKGDDADFRDMRDTEINTQSTVILDEAAEKAKELIQDVEINPALTVEQNLDNAKEKSGIVCEWSENGMWQISHDGGVYRCCWHQSNYNYWTRLNSGDKQAWDRFMDNYDENWNNINYHTWDEIVNHPFFTEDLEKSWSNSYDDEVMPKLKVCTKRCSKLNVELSPRIS